MALSFAEKRTLQKEIQSCFASLAERPDFKTKRTLQKRLAEAFAKLEGGNGNIKETLLDQLIAGKFISYSAQRFFSILKQAMQEVQNNLEPLKEPIIAFLNAHKDEMQLDGSANASSGVFESASSLLGMNGINTCPAPKSSSAAVRVTPNGLEYGSPQTITIDIDTDFDSPETFREIIRAIEQARSVDTLILKKLAWWAHGFSPGNLCCAPGKQSQNHRQSHYSLFFRVHSYDGLRRNTNNTSLHHDDS